MSGKPKNYTDEFKKRIVQLAKSGDLYLSFVYWYLSFWECDEIACDETSGDFRTF